MKVYVDRIGVCSEVPNDLLHGLQFGEGAFETIRVDEHRGIEWCDRHWRRWQKGLTYLGVNVSSYLRMDDWIMAIQALKNDSGCSNPWMVARPQGVITNDGELRWWIQWNKGKQWNHPLKMGRVPVTPLPEDDKPAALKLNMMSHYRQAERLAADNGWDHPLLCTKDGCVSESSRANLFWVKDGCFYTPSLSCLPLHGVMRDAFINWIQTIHGSQLIEVSATFEELQQVDAILLSNSLQRITWVDNLEGSKKMKPDAFDHWMESFDKVTEFTPI